MELEPIGEMVGFSSWEAKPKPKPKEEKRQTQKVPKEVIWEIKRKMPRIPKDGKK